MNGSEDRRADALRWIDQATLRDLLAAYYRDLGWWVETTADDDRPGGMADDAAEEAPRAFGLVLKRDRDVILLDCRHWGDAPGPGDAVATLVRAIERRGATGGILVGSGPFTRVDIDAANRHGHIRLIDGDGLRGMLGELPEPCGQADPLAPPPRVSSTPVRPAGTPRSGALVWWLIALACLLLFVLLVRALLARTADTAMPREAVASHVAEHSSRDAAAPRRLDGRAATADAAAHLSAMRAAALRGDQASSEAELHAANDALLRAMRLADPARRVDRESARIAVRDVPGVRSAVWIDHENLFVMVSRNDQRSFSTIDAVCAALDPLGDTLGIVVHLQSAAARDADEVAILDRNCQLAPGERATLQSHRQVDAMPARVRAQHRANNPRPEVRPASGRADPHGEEAMRVIESTTPAM